MPSDQELEAAARALAYKARRERATDADARIYADLSWQLWLESAKVALDAAELVRANATR